MFQSQIQVCKTFFSPPYLVLVLNASKSQTLIFCLFVCLFVCLFFFWNTGAFVSDMETKNINVMNGQKNTLHASADASFHSAATVTPGALGAITFELRTPTDSSEIISSAGIISSEISSDEGEAVPNNGGGGVTIGTVTMPSTFGVLPGKNHVSAKVEMIKDGTTANAFAIASFIDQYAMGHEHI